ncbi:related to DEG1 - pseudouridine synthase [Ustilago sp. UG-2017b]|nr:related to DEG1 - pseudouridine synthase [Ustilago sp. UG-2017b]
MELKSRYADWTKDSLLSRIAELEAQTTSLRAAKAEVDTLAHLSCSSHPATSHEQGGQKKGGKKEKKAKEFDFASSPCRKIALRFSYDGAGYSGLAAQNATPHGTGSSLPTVEGVLWDALCTARLVDPSLGMDGAGFSRCGRTDRGVSAAGQVVALWVRSKKVNHWIDRVSLQSSSPSPSPLPPLSKELEEKRKAKLEKVELPYVQILNRILPPTIRIQAWSPVRANFSARFDCTYRHYKYFFPSGPPSVFFPPNSPFPSSSSTSAGVDAATKRLDIGLMRDAAKRLSGEHDFRNLCKVDGSKQITNYRRRIDGVSIDRVSPSSLWPTTSNPIGEGEVKGGESGEGEEGGEGEGMFVLNLRGTAFLYHQVRNIMAILFLIGARLERPEVIEELMNTETGQIASDRIKMRLAASNSLSSTDGEGIEWWLPINSTSPSSILSCSSPQVEHLPMWIASSLATDPSSHSASDSTLEVYTTKANYEMASDRPLVLWECGFLPTDISWRVATFDGPTLTSATQREVEENCNTASNCLLRTHKSWTQQTISAELSRHFVLASPSAWTGTLPSRTSFNDSAYPYLTKGEPKVRLEVGGGKGREERGKSGVIPLGNGTGRGAANYVPLKQRPREEPYQVKNRRWAETTGKRRAERKAAQQEADWVDA